MRLASPRAAQPRKPRRRTGRRVALSALALFLGLTSALPSAGALELPVVERGARVTVRAEAGLERRARRAAERAASDLARIETDLAGLPRVTHVEVRLVKRAEALAAVAPPGRRAPAWATGVAWPGTGVVAVAARGRQGELLDWERTLSHELAHMALDEALAGHPVPRWLTEGFAYLHSSDFSWGRARTLMGAVIGGRIIPLGALEDAFPAREDEASLAYAQAYDFVAFLARRGRWEDERDDGSRAAFQELIARLSAGDPPSRAAERAFGRTLGQLEREWLESLRTRYLWYPIGIGATSLWVFASALLVVGWWRRRREGRRTLRRWEIEEVLRDAAAAGDRDPPS